MKDLYPMYVANAQYTLNTQNEKKQCKIKICERK